MSKKRKKSKLLKLEAKEFNPHPRFYFAYGSNLDLRSMKGRCPDCTPICAAQLPDYILSFTGVLTIERNPGTYVLGGIFEVSLDDIDSLDIYEGWPHLYVKRYTHAVINGKREKVFYYVIPEETVRLGVPSGFYWDVVAQGYRDFGLPIAHLEEARERAREAQRKEPDIEYLAAMAELEDVHEGSYIIEID